MSQPSGPLFSPPPQVVTEFSSALSEKGGVIIRHDPDATNETILWFTYLKAKHNNVLLQNLSGLGHKQIYDRVEDKVNTLVILPADPPSQSTFKCLESAVAAGEFLKERPGRSIQDTWAHHGRSWYEPWLETTAHHVYEMEQTVRREGSIHQSSWYADNVQDQRFTALTGKYSHLLKDVEAAAQSANYDTALWHTFYSLRHGVEEDTSGIKKLLSSMAKAYACDSDSDLDLFTDDAENVRQTVAGIESMITTLETNGPKLVVTRDWLHTASRAAS